MKSKCNLALLLALGVGLLGGTASAQNSQIAGSAGARVEYGTYDGNQSGALQQADWDDHRRCDGDHDRDDRGCYQQYYNRDRYYGYSYYGNGYAPAYNYAPPAGYCDRNGRWHAYDRDRDRDRRRHRDNDDDRR